MDKVQIKRLRVRCKIGVRPRERRIRQTLLVEVTCYCDLSAEAVRDRLERTVDYSTLASKVRSFVEQSQFYLIETLADRIALICLENDLVQMAIVGVSKPHVIPRSQGACVEVTRHRTGARVD
jgi:FolB domain-containing protein